MLSTELEMPNLSLFFHMNCQIIIYLLLICRIYFASNSLIFHDICTMLCMVILSLVPMLCSYFFVFVHLIFLFSPSYSSFKSCFYSHFFFFSFFHVAVVKEPLHVFFVCFAVTPTGSGQLMQAAAPPPGPRPFTWPASSIPPHHGNVCVCSL